MARGLLRLTSCRGLSYGLPPQKPGLSSNAAVRFFSFMELLLSPPIDLMKVKISDGGGPSARFPALVILPIKEGPVPDWVGCGDPVAPGRPPDAPRHVALRGHQGGGVHSVI